MKIQFGKISLKNWKWLQEGTFMSDCGYLFSAYKLTDIGESHCSQEGNRTLTFLVIHVNASTIRLETKLFQMTVTWELRTMNLYILKH